MTETLVFEEQDLVLVYSDSVQTIVFYEEEPVKLSLAAYAASWARKATVDAATTVEEVSAALYRWTKCLSLQ